MDTMKIVDRTTTSILQHSLLW